MGHQLAHGRLEVVVAHHAAGDAAGAGRDRGLVDHQDVLAAALALGFQLGGQVPGGRQAVNAGADDDGLDVRGQGHGTTPIEWQ